MEFMIFLVYVIDYVHFLVEKKQQLEAIRYIHAFELDDKLPMVPLLEDHLKCCEKVSRKICKKRNYSSAARVCRPLFVNDYLFLLPSIRFK